MILNIQLQITLIIASLIFFIIVFNASIKKKLSIRYSVLWFALSLFFIILSIWPNSIMLINNIIKIREPIHTVFLIIFSFILLLVFTYNYTISKLVSENRMLIQELGIVKKRLNDLEKGEKE